MLMRIEELQEQAGESEANKSCLHTSAVQVSRKTGGGDWVLVITEASPTSATWPHCKPMNEGSGDSVYVSQ